MNLVLTSSHILLPNRTDSETTDEQCIPESVSEINDSAIDSTEDLEIDVEEDLKEEEKEDRLELSFDLMQEEEEPERGHPVDLTEAESSREEDTKVDLNSQDRRDSSSKVTSPASSVTSSSAAAPLICLEVRDSSTESDKTVLFVNTVLDQAAGVVGVGGGGGRATDSLPSTPSIVSQASLPLPEIVVEEPRTPPATSPLTSPATENGGGCVECGGDRGDDSNEEKDVDRSIAVGNGGATVTRRRSPSPKLVMPKASSLPPLSGERKSTASQQTAMRKNPLHLLNSNRHRRSPQLPGVRADVLPAVPALRLLLPQRISPERPALCHRRCWCRLFRRRLHPVAPRQRLCRQVDGIRRDA